jgi:hypothetical protein
MPRIIPLLALFATLTAVASAAEARTAANDRYCLQGRHWGMPGNCQFATRQQCLAAAAGTNAHCGLNPRNASARQR